MNSLIPLFIIIPLATAFIIPIIGKLTNYFAKTITPIILLVLCFLSISLLLGSKNESYIVGGWQPVNDIPIGIYLVLDGYARGDILQTLFKYDNSSFYNTLTHMGFYVASNLIRMMLK